MKPATTEPRVAWRATQPWSAARPQTLVVCCSDGRWHDQLEEFIREDIAARSDVYAVPGGPAVFDTWSSSFEECRAAELSARFFVENHDIRSTWLISHENCAYYRARRPFDTPAQLEERQRADLLKARAAIRRAAPAIEVRLVHAALDGQSVVFREIEER